MCRIAGIIDLSNKIDLHQSIVAMRDSMHRGGPNDAGLLVDDENRIALGHRRLALIDLSPAGHQPMSYNNGDIVIIFNGEIYNFAELKGDLQTQGLQFNTSSDTEVILAAYQAYGHSCFQKFNGMFALAIWDKKKQNIILARDHASIKPLYFSLTAEKLIFASEIRAFKALDPHWPENEDWKIPFLTFGHLPEPFTTLQGVIPLQKGSYIEISTATLDSKLTVFNKFEFSKKVRDLNEATALVRNTLDSAVKRHLISDAPIGLFLSGGVDSSLLTLIANKYVGGNLKTLSIVFEDATFNEAPYQKLIVDKTNAQHHSFLVTEKEFQEELPNILEAMDQPSIDGINSYFICKYAKMYGLTAVLSGLGADELFGGYPSFNHTKSFDLIQKFPGLLLGMAEYFTKETLKKISFAKQKTIVGQYLFNRGSFTPLQVAKILGVSSKKVIDVLQQVRIEDLPKGTNQKDRVSWMETHLYMQNQLLKDTDFMSMWHGLEVRVPFLDKELMLAAYSIDPAVKYDKKIGKHLLIKAFDDLLPKEIWQRKKQGFTFPLHKWLASVVLNISRPGYSHTRKLFLNKKLHWSRYWTYLLAFKTEKLGFEKKKHNNILFLNLTTFSSTGGIQKFNRSFLKALRELESDGFSAHSISLHDKEVDEKYFSANNYKLKRGKIFSFIVEAVRLASTYDTIIIGHINLALPALIIKRLFPKKKIILIAHGIEVWEDLKGAKKKLLSKVDKIIAVSSFTKSKLIELQNVPAEKITILHNTIDPYFLAPTNFSKPEYLKKRYSIHNGEKIIYTFTRMSSLEQYKGYDKVLEVLPALKKTYPGIKYIIGGKADADEKRRMQMLIEKNNLTEDVILAGFIADNEVSDHFQLADVFVMPSSKEGFGIVFLEAMACGIPVLGGNLDGTVDALQNGKLGVLVNPVISAEIKKGIEKQIEKNYKNEDSLQLQQDVYKCFAFPLYKQKIKNLLLAEETWEIN